MKYYRNGCLALELEYHGDGVYSIVYQDPIIRQLLVEGSKMRRLFGGVYIGSDKHPDFRLEGRQPTLWLRGDSSDYDHQKFEIPQGYWSGVNEALLEFMDFECDRRSLEDEFFSRDLASL